MSNHRINYPPLPAERNPYEAADKAEALRGRIVPNAELAGRFYWPSDHYSVPADNLCWHVPPSPNADYRCTRENGHAGKHKYDWSPTLRDYPHKGRKEDDQ